MAAEEEPAAKKVKAEDGEAVPVNSEQPAVSQEKLDVEKKEKKDKEKTKESGEKKEKKDKEKDKENIEKKREKGQVREEGKEG